MGKKISRGTPEQLMNAVKQQIARLGGDADIESTTSIDSSKEISDADVIDWLADHDQAYQDCQDYFGVDDLSQVDPVHINNWICDHDRLFEDFVHHFGHEAVGIESATHFPVDDVLKFLEAKGYDTSTFEVKSYAEGVADYMDMSRQAYENNDMDWPYTLDQWYKDTQQNYGYILDDLPKTGDIDSACNSCNVVSSSELSVTDQEKLYEIADRYVSSDPVSGDWDTETSHEQKAISDELGVSLEEAKQLMKEYLGFTDDMFNITSAEVSDVDEMTYDVVEAGEDVADVKELDDSDEYIKALSSKLDKWAEDNNIDAIKIDHDDEALYADVTTGDSKICSYTVPYADLSFKEDAIDTDLDYITEAIKVDLGDSKIKECESIKSSDDLDDDYDPSDYEGGYTEWDLLDKKSVRDSDGFFTDYTLWYNEFTDMYVCIFGDSDIYYPENADYDAEFETEDEAREWFDSYSGFEDDDDIM